MPSVNMVSKAKDRVDRILAELLLFFRKFGEFHFSISDVVPSRIW